MAREMKDSGIQWVGIIPADWECRRLRFLCEIQTGNQDTQDSVPDGLFPFYVRSPIVERSNRYTFEGPAILMAGDGAGAGRVFHYVDGKYGCHQRVYSLQKITDINRRFLYYYLSSLFYREIEIANSKSTVDSVRLPMLQNFRVVFPNDHKQKKIVEYLDSKCAEIDDVLAKTRTSIEEYKKLKQAIITQAVTKGVRGDRPMKESGSTWFGVIPADWEMCKTKKLAKIEKRIAGTEGLTVLSITQKGIRPKELSKNEGQLAASYSNYQIVHPGDFAMNHMDLLTGWIDISRFEGVTSPDYRVFTMPVNNSVNKRYYLYLFQMCYFNRIYYGLGQGVSGLGRWRLPANQFLNFFIPVPSIEEQDEIVKYLNNQCAQIDALIQKKQQLLATLESYKKSLIYEYVTGKKEVEE